MPKKLLPVLTDGTENVPRPDVIGDAQLQWSQNYEIGGDGFLETRKSLSEEYDENLTTETDKWFYGIGRISEPYYPRTKPSDMVGDFIIFIWGLAGKTIDGNNYPQCAIYAFYMVEGGTWKSGLAEELTNGNFEDGTTGWTVHGGATISDETDSDISGAWLEIEGSGANSGCYQDITGIPAANIGTEYIMRFKCVGTDYIWGNTPYGTPQIHITDITGAPADIVAITDITVTADEWNMFHSVTFIIPPSCTAIRIYLLSKANGEYVHFDEVSVKQNGGIVIGLRDPELNYDDPESDLRFKVCGDRMVFTDGANRAAYATVDNDGEIVSGVLGIKPPTNKATVTDLTAFNDEDWEETEGEQYLAEPGIFQCVYTVSTEEGDESNPSPISLSKEMQFFNLGVDYVESLRFINQVLIGDLSIPNVGTDLTERLKYFNVYIRILKYSEGTAGKVFSFSQQFRIIDKTVTSGSTGNAYSVLIPPDLANTADYDNDIAPIAQFAAFSNEVIALGRVQQRTELIFPFQNYIPIAITNPNAQSYTDAVVRIQLSDLVMDVTAVTDFATYFGGGTGLNNKDLFAIVDDDLTTLLPVNFIDYAGGNTLDIYVRIPLLPAGQIKTLYFCFSEPDLAAGAPIPSDYQEYEYGKFFHIGTDTWADQKVFAIDRIRNSKLIMMTDFEMPVPYNKANTFYTAQPTLSVVPQSTPIAKIADLDELMGGYCVKFTVAADSLTYANNFGIAAVPAKLYISFRIKYDGVNLVNGVDYDLFSMYVDANKNLKFMIADDANTPRPQIFASAAPVVNSTELFNSIAFGDSGGTDYEYFVMFSIDRDSAKASCFVVDMTTGTTQQQEVTFATPAGYISDLSNSDFIVGQADIPTVLDLFLDQMQMADGIYIDASNTSDQDKVRNMANFQPAFDEVIGYKHSDTSHNNNIAFSEPETTEWEEHLNMVRWSKINGMNFPEAYWKIISEPITKLISSPHFLQFQYGNSFLMWTRNAINRFTLQGDPSGWKAKTDNLIEEFSDFGLQYEETLDQAGAALFWKAEVGVIKWDQNGLVNISENRIKLPNSLHWIGFHNPVKKQYLLKGFQSGSVGGVFWGLGRKEPGFEQPFVGYISLWHHAILVKKGLMFWTWTNFLTYHHMAVLIRLNDDGTKEKGEVYDLGGTCYYGGHPVKIARDDLTDGRIVHVHSDALDSYKIYGQVLTCNDDLTITVPGYVKIVDEGAKGEFDIVSLATNEFSLVYQAEGGAYDPGKVAGFTVAGAVITHVASTHISNALWNLGAGWDLESVQSNLVATAASSSAVADSSSAVVGQTYRIKFEVTNYAAGSVVVNFGGVSTAALSGNGTIDENILAVSGGAYSVIGTGFTGRVKSIKIETILDYSFDDTNQWVKGTGWSVAGGAATVDGSQTEYSYLSPLLPPVIKGKRIHVTSASPGTLSPVIFVGGKYDSLDLAISLHYYRATNNTCTIRAAAGVVAQVNSLSVDLHVPISLGLNSTMNVVESNPNEAMIFTKTTTGIGSIESYLFTQTAGTPVMTFGSYRMVEHHLPSGSTLTLDKLEDGKVLIGLYRVNSANWPNLVDDRLQVITSSGGNTSLLGETSVRDYYGSILAYNQTVRVRVVNSTTFIMLGTDASNARKRMFTVWTINGVGKSTMVFAGEINAGEDAYLGTDANVGAFSEDNFLVVFPDRKNPDDLYPYKTAAMYEIWNIDKIVYDASSAGQDELIVPGKVYPPGDTITWGWGWYDPTMMFVYDIEKDKWMFFSTRYHMYNQPVKLSGGRDDQNVNLYLYPNDDATGLEIKRYPGREDTDREVRAVTKRFYIEDGVFKRLKFNFDGETANVYAIVRNVIDDVITPKIDEMASIVPEKWKGIKAVIGKGHSIEFAIDTAKTIKSLIFTFKNRGNEDAT